MDHSLFGGTTLHKLIFAAAIAMAALPAQAAIVVDKSVDVLSMPAGFNATNAANSQNFLVRFTLGSATTLTGASIYSAGSFVSLGDGVLIKFRNDVEGGPDLSNFAALNSSLSLINSDGASSNPTIQQLYASFTPLALSAGTYWFGMSGSTSDIGWEIDFGSATGTPAWQLSADSLQFAFGPTAALSFRLYDGAPLGGAVPEPASWAMLIAGFGLTGATLRRRRQMAAAVSA
jgi:hypothetical protein